MPRRLARVALVAVLAVTLALIALEGALQLAARLAAPRRGSDEQARARATIVVYGDSTPYGLGNEVRFSDELARLLGVEVANRSWPGLNSTQVANIVHDDLRNGRATPAPRVLIVMAGVNDGWNVEDVPTDLLGAAARWQHKLPRLRTIRLLTIGLEGGLGRDAYDSSVSKGWSRRDETARLLSSEGVRRIQSASYRRMRDDARERGSEVLFLGYQAEGWNHVADLAEDVLRSEHGDRVLPLRDLFSDGDARRMIQPDAFHPTDDGQRAIAARVAAEIRARGWLERTAHGTDGAPPG